ncbi:MAG: transposase [Bacillota bacterium]
MPKHRWTVEEKLQIVLAGLMPEANIAAICREHQLSQSLFYRWRDAFLKGGTAALQNGPSTREQELEKKLREAQAKIGEQALQIDILKKKTNWVLK